MASDLTINTGMMRQRISLMQPGQGADASGGQLPPSTFATVWAAVDTLSGGELYKSQQFTSEANRIVTMRWLAGVLPSMTVAFGSRTFQILYADNVQEQNVKLVLYCKEILS